MSVDLRYICQSLIANKSNLLEYDAIVEQFISSVSIDSIFLASLANDPSFPTFVQCLMFSLTRVPIPSNAEGKASKRVLNIIQFLTQIAYLSPDISRIISANMCSDSILNNFFKKASEDTNGRKVDPARHLPFLKFVTILALESDMFISSTESIGYFYTVATDLFKSPDVAKWAIASVTALVKNSPIAASFIKSTHNFAKLRTMLASLLSSDDPAVVISSLSLLVMLFPASISPNTSVKASVNAIGALENFPPSMHLISWIILELYESSPLNAENIWTLLQIAMRGDNRAFVIYNLLIDLPSQHLMIVDVMQSMNCLFALINSLLDAEDGFVAIAGCSFLYTIFHDSNDFVFSEDVVEPFTKALRLVLAMRKFAQSERREAAVLLLRFMVRARESITHVIRILQENEQSLFLDFQRQIELNNSFLSVVYFLFLYESSHFLAHWRQKLIALVIDSQFPALLVHVISESRNRRAIGDALRSSQILADGMKNDIIYETSPMFDSIVSGYLLLNQKRYEDNRKERSNSVQLQDELFSKIMALEVERDCCEKEISTIKESLDQSSAMIQDEQIQRKNMDEENAQLKKSLAASKFRTKKLSEQVKELEGANIALSQQLESMKKNASSASIRESDVRAKINCITQLETSLHKSEETVTKLQNQIKQLKTAAENDRKQSEKYKQKIAKMKKSKFSQRHQANNLANNINELEHEKNELQKALSQYDKEMKNLIAYKDKLEKAKEDADIAMHNLKLEMERVQKNRDEIVAKAEMRIQKVDDLQDKINLLEDQNREFQMLVKLIHKTTHPNQALPQTILSFMKTA
ncbi:hypothetical protein TRFO_23631 [Tritrichomonas foetus]|uniref:Uncharacterized protein n=1 Tax=Tritrichomonas foetus TaxID=1144522 RepID=A0A1J4K9V8_9EUKA|nr:hypothetical protein TRFO_23631 [Tritrichomonas foetus]|eukprot:OHT08011.1 hypothetical protein TRFO_23631 [Tritrichomonas foetus]